MKVISAEAAKSIFKNCLELKQTPEGIMPVRFTPKQMEAYRPVPVRFIRANSPSSVCLDFSTDSSFVRIEFSIKGIARNWAFFDVYINNEFTGSLGSSPISESLGRIDFAIPQTDRKVNRLTIYLPHLVELTIKSIELSEGSKIEAEEEYSKKLLCLGDSITQGMDAQYPSCTYPLQLSRYFGMELLNQGVGGYVFNRDSLDEAISFSPDIITVAYGTNDWGVCKSAAEFEENCRAYMDRLTAIFPRARVFLITPTWRKDIDGTGRPFSFSELSGIMLGMCSSYTNMSAVNGLEMVPHMPEFFGDQSLHPNDRGFMHYAVNLMKEISGRL